MRAQDIFEQTVLPNGSELLAEQGNMWLWKIPLALYNKIADTFKGQFNEHPPLPATHGDIYWLSPVRDYQGLDLYPRDTGYFHEVIFFTTQGNNLIAITYGFANRISPLMLKKIAQITGATSSEGLFPEVDTKGYALYKGQVRKQADIQAQYEIQPLKDGTTGWRIPREDIWATGRRDPFSDSSYTHYWVLDNPVARIIKLASDRDTVIDAAIPYKRVEPAVNAVKELAKTYGLTLGISLPEPKPKKASKVQPNSNMHKMLKYIAEHPNSTRSDWYVKHLGNAAQGMPGWTDNKSIDARAVQLGWMTNKGAPGSYSLSLTRKGEMVLARLNNNQPMPYSL